MKKILILALLIISISSFAQFPATQSMGTVNTRVVSNGAFDATKGLINGVFADTTAANGAQIWTSSDMNFWLRSTALNMWIRMAKFSETGGGFTANLPIRITGTVISADTSFAYDPSLSTNKRIQKIIDSLDAAGWDVSGSGTINSGTTGKPAYYVGATTLDDFIAVDYATSGTNMLLTTQNTTDVGLNIKGVSSQTANLLNISSSSGTGDLFAFQPTGRLGIGDTGPQTLLQVGNDGGASSGFGTAAQILFSNNGSTTYITGLGPTSTEVFFGAESGKGVMGMLSNHDYELRTNNTTRLILQSTGELTVNTHMEMIEQSAPSTPASTYVKIYPKSDGLWYGKDDAGVETQLSNAAGGTPTLQQVLTAGPNLSSSHTIDVAANLLDITGSANPVNISTTSGASPALDIYNFTSTNNDVIDIFRVGRASSTTVADGFGVRQTFSLESASGANQESNNLISKWTTAANATRTSRFAIQGVVNGISGELLGIGDYVTLTESSATIFTSTTLATGTIQGGTILVTVEANDATDFQSRTLRFIWSAVNKAGNLFISVSTPEEVVAVSSGTLTVSITLVNAGGGVLDFKANAVSSLTQSTLRATYQTFKNF